jgi:hypothetical protein
MRTGPGGLKIASLRQRNRAALIDVPIWVAGFAALATVGGRLVAKRLMGLHPADLDATTISTWVAEHRVHLEAVSMIAGVATRNHRGLGYRLVGLRRADARTGGPVSIRSALINHARGEHGGSG